MQPGCASLVLGDSKVAEAGRSNGQYGSVVDPRRAGNGMSRYSALRCCPSCMDCSGIACKLGLILLGWTALVSGGSGAVWLTARWTLARLGATATTLTVYNLLAGRADLLRRELGPARGGASLAWPADCSMCHGPWHDRRKCSRPVESDPPDIERGSP